MTLTLDGPGLVRQEEMRREEPQGFMGDDMYQTPPIGTLGLEHEVSLLT